MSTHGSPRWLPFRLQLSFFLFGLINNVLYVIILSAALDLVPPSTPKGIIAFCNIFPALLVKLGWPYLLKGRIRYARRLIGCCVISITGMIVVASFDILFMRLLGIALASFSSGMNLPLSTSCLGELTFLQLSTRYHPLSVAGHAVGYFASGTGAAGVGGAFLWWEVRSLGVRTGVGISSILPLVIPATYYLLLPRPSPLLHWTYLTPVTAPYTPLPTADDETVHSFEPTGDIGAVKGSPALSLRDKWQLAKPLLFEYTINQGIAPTLVYPVPSPDEHWLISKIIHSIRDYYPLWQRHTAGIPNDRVLLSLLHISRHPPLPARLISLPSFIQAAVLTVLAIESAVGFFGEQSEGLSIFFVFLLISLEGICGGLAYVNVFFRVNQERPTDGDAERARQEREFKIGSIGLADSAGILLASLVAVPTEIELCKVQVARGKLFCESL
ncbi:batten's disease protein Cln3 [Amylocystis lapponica]|nr:batten's disease protein Cln3 [Amylocystis lapponica]